MVVRVSGLLLLVTAACADVCPPPPATGGTAAERAIVDLEVTRMVESFVLGQCVRSIQLVEGVDLEDAAGAYHLRGRRIELESGYPPTSIRSTTRHELCHAGQHQSAPTEPDRPVWAIQPDLPEDDPTEVFAMACETGPIVAHVLDDACDADAGHPSTARSIRGMYRRPDEVVDRDATWEEIASLDAGGFDALDVLLGDRLLVSAGQASWVVDLWTGAPASLTLPAPPTPVPPPLYADYVPKRLLSAAHSKGVTLGVLVVDGSNGARLERVFLQDEDGVGAVGCARRGERVFEAAGGLWSAWVGGGVVRWGRWVW